MTQEERRRWLIRYLQREMPEYAHYGIPDDEAGQGGIPEVQPS